MNRIRSWPLALTVGLIITDALFFGLTDPSKVASILLIVGFGLILITLYWIIRCLQRIASLYAPSIAAQKRLPLTIVTVLGVILALQSVGQLTFRDGMLIPLAAAVFYMYSTYGKSSTP